MAQVPALLTVAEVAERLRVSDETLHRWARDGLVPFVPLPSGIKRFKREVIEAIERGEFVPEPSGKQAGAA